VAFSNGEAHAEGTRPDLQDTASAAQDSMRRTEGRQTSVRPVKVR
jgi:hypothetical protein